MTASGQRLKSRKKRQDNQTQINNLKKLEKISKEKRGKKITTRKRVNGKLVNVSYYTGSDKMSNIPSKGQRKLVLQAGGSGLPADYKKTEKKAFKEAEKFKKTQAKEKLKINKNKTTGGGSTRTKSSTPTGYVRYKGKLVSTRTAQGKHAMNKLKAKKRAQEMAKKRLGK